MYQALYRKYRPATFDDVVGQDVIVKTLKNAIINNKLSHAYIFSGPRGTGKTSIAKILAKAVNCENKEKIICDRCVSCTQINNKQSVDIIEIDAASNNGIDEIREIRNKASLVPSSGKYKVYIIDEVHMLTTGAFNALLKTLEEPPQHVIFILATTEEHKIPSTILSRCQKFNFKKIDDNKMFYKIKKIVELENIDIDINCIEEIIRLSDGGLRDCISLLDQVNAYANGKIHYKDICDINGIIGYETIINFIKALFNKNIKFILKEISLFNSDGKNFIKITEEILLHLKNILIINIDENLINDKRYKDFQNMKNDDIIKIIDLINNNLEQMKNNSNTLLTFQILMLKVCNIDYNYDFNLELKKELNVENINIDYKNSNEILNENDDVENEIKNEKNINVEDKIIRINYNDYDVEQLLKELQNVRIDNALSKFNKNILIMFKEKMNELKKYNSIPKYSFAADLIMDGCLKAISDEYIVVMYNTNLTAETFNRKLNIIEELISKIFDRKLKAIAIDKDSWDIIKNDFNNKSRDFKYNIEDEQIFSALINKVNNEQNKLDDLYGSLVKYEEEN